MVVYAWLPAVVALSTVIAGFEAREVAAVCFHAARSSDESHGIGSRTHALLQKECTRDSVEPSV